MSTEKLDMGRRLRLRIDSSGLLAGRKSGLQVHVGQVLRGWAIKVWPTCLLPEGTVVESFVDHDHVVWDVRDGDVADLRWLLGSPEVLAATEALGAEGRHPIIRDGAVTVVTNANDTPPALEQAIAVARAISDRRLESVHALVDRLGLGSGRYFRPDRQTGPLPVRVVGTGFEVVLPWLDGNTWRATVRAQLKSPLPDGSEVVGVSEARDPSVELGDLIFDSSPLVVHTSDPQGLKARLCADEVRGPLLDALCDNPGSELTATAIRVELSRGVLDIDRAVSDVLQLVDALG